MKFIISLYRFSTNIPIMYKVIAFFFITLLSAGSAISQVVTDIPPDSAMIKEYERRTKLTRIDGKYIPKDLNDALLELDKIMDEGAKKKFLEYTEEDARTKTHFSFGKYINARWSIQEGSRLTAWFQKNKIFNYDDMIDVVITTYHRKLSKKPIEFEALATYHYKKRLKVAQELQKEKEARDAKYKKGE